MRIREYGDARTQFAGPSYAVFRFYGRLSFNLNLGSFNNVVYWQDFQISSSKGPELLMTPLNRESAISRLRKEPFDILIIGGGATGAGIALDAATRGLRVALVESEDFSAGTSSRSTKLIHGGVRYLEKAVLQMDRSQFRLVRDALKERTILLKIAPHLARWLPIMTPVYHRFELPYVRTGLRMYDWLAGRASVHKSKFVSKMETIKRVSFLRKEGLRGGVVYYDGQFDDSRMNISIALKAAELGAVIANHVSVQSLARDNGKITGAVLRDNFTEETWSIAAKVTVNATGPFVDSIRKMDDPNAPPILNASSGTHLILDKTLPLTEMGVLIPKTEDKRVLFILPWLGYTLVGTTDNPAEIVDNPKPTEEDRDFILRQLNQYSAVPITAKNIRASWSGLRPLFSETHSKSTAGLSRDHVILVSPSGLLSVAGGKWTTYRLMAFDATNEAVRVGELKPKNVSQTETTAVAGGDKFTPDIAKQLSALFKLDSDIAEHLSRAYGDRAVEIGMLTQKHGERLAPGYPFTEAEVIYAVTKESARTIPDVIARRFRLAFLDTEAALASISKVASLMAELLNWNAATRAAEEKRAKAYF